MLKKCEAAAMDPDPHGPARCAAEILLRDPALPMTEIARRIGVSPQRVRTWNRRACLRPPPARRRALENWPPERRAAAQRLIAEAGADPGDLTEALGFARGSAGALLGALGAKRPGRASDPDRRSGGRAAPPRRLRTLLRMHIGRQIEAFDAALAAPPVGMDSAKVLRDLGGLKRLLDDLAPGDELPGSDDGGEGDAHDGPPRPGHDRAPDLDAVRAEIARRYERFVGGGAPG